MALLNDAKRLPRVVIAGCSYGGMSVVANLIARIDNAILGPGAAPKPDQTARLKRGVEITVIDERDGWFHLVGTPLAHTSKAHVKPFWRQYDTVSYMQRPDVKFNRGRITKVDPAGKLVTFENPEDSSKVSQIEYDYFVLATGMSREWPSAPRKISKKDYTEDSLNHIAGIEKVPNGRVVVIGGGAVGIEIAAEVKHNHPSQTVTLIHSRSKLLSNEPLPDEFKDRAHSCLNEEGVEVILNERASISTTEDADGTVSIVTLSNGDQIRANHIIWATSKNIPNTQVIAKEALDEEGFVKVTQELRFDNTVANSNIHFAIGDVISRKGIRRAGGALLMGRIAATNIYDDLLKAEGTSDETPADIFPYYGPVMGLAVGKQMVAYTESTGVTWGQEMMEQSFGTDLGWKGTLAHLGLPKELDEDKEVQKAEF